MSVYASNWVWKKSRARTPADRLVLLAIADRANDEGRDAWPSLSTLCEKTQLHRSTVIRSVERLVEMGELEVEVKPGRSNRYRMPMPDYPDVQAPTEVEVVEDEELKTPKEVVVAECDHQPVGPSQNATSRKMRPVAKCDQSQKATNPSQKATSTSRITRPNTSSTYSTSSTHTPRAREGRNQGSLISKGEPLRWAQDQDKQHRSCHPEVCKWRGTTRGVCLPSALVTKFAEKLIGVESNAAIADVIEWARNDTPPAGVVATGDDFRYWRGRWDATRASKHNGVGDAAAAVRHVPSASETDLMIEEMSGGRFRPSAVP